MSRLSAWCGTLAPTLGQLATFSFLTKLPPSPKMVWTNLPWAKEVVVGENSLLVFWIVRAFGNTLRG